MVWESSGGLGSPQVVWESSGGLGGNSTGEEFGPRGAKPMVGCGVEVACGGLFPWMHRWVSSAILYSLAPTGPGTSRSLLSVCLGVSVSPVSCCASV